MENVFKNNILKKVQISKASHQKNLKILGSIYGKTHYSEFKDVLFRFLRIIFSTNNLPIRNDHVERSLDFLANFVSLVTPQDEEIENIDEDTPLTPFLSDVIVETLKYHNICNESVRYNSCLFVRLILQNIGHQTHLDNEICDLIEEAMLERIMDRKAAIRLQAVMALVRLQDPLNPDCPILKAYLTLIYDGNALIRAEVVKNIAPFGLTVPHIIKRLKDIDNHVRSVTFRRCADLGPKHFKIVERQHILQCGISETSDKSKKVFLEHLLPKWLNAYNGSFILLLNSLKLDADESDIVILEEISKEIMDFFLRTVPINDVTENLPLTDEKLISIDKLSSEVVLLWNIVVNYLRHTDDLEEYLENILPELSPFCNYIESIINNANNKKMEEWEYLEYQYILYNLFEIAEGYDFSDEVGRKRLYQLIMNILKDEQLQFRLMKKLVKIVSQLTSEDFINIICHVISEIREPLVEVEKPVNKDDETNKKFELASLKVKLNILEGELEDALDCQEFLKANDLKEKIVNIKQKIESVNIQKTPLEQVRVLKDDAKTLCRCLDLLIALLELPKIKEFTQSLVTVKDEFLMPLLNSNSSEINWRVLNCLALLSLLDEKLAEEYIKILCIPIITYRAIPNYNKAALLISVKSVCDLYLVYGPKVFGDDNSTHNTTSTINTTTKRRLYRNEDVEESIMNPAKLHLELIIDIILDMMDDENAEIHDTAVLCITKLILGNFPVNSALIARIVLKWYNPLTAKCSQKFKQMLGVMIGQYASTIKGARDVIAKAVIPILNSIAGAPKTSPLVDVDVDNLLHFLAVITTTGEQMDVVNTHVSLAHALCLEILKKTNSTVVIYLTKMLTYLEVPSENANVLKELIAQINIILAEEENLEKNPRKFVLRFLQKLKNTLDKETALESNNLETIGEEAENVDTNVHAMKDSTNKSVLDHSTHDSDKSQSIQNSNTNLPDLHKEPNVYDKKQKQNEQADKSNLSTAQKRTRNGKLKNTTTDITSSNEDESSTDMEQSRRTDRNYSKVKLTNNGTTDSTSELETRKKKKTAEKHDQKHKGKHNSLLSTFEQTKNKKINANQVSNDIEDHIIKQSVHLTENDERLKAPKELKTLKRSRRNRKINDKNKSNGVDSSSDTELEIQPAKKKLIISVKKIKSPENNNVKIKKGLRQEDTDTKKVVEVRKNNGGRRKVIEDNHSLNNNNSRNVRAIHNVDVESIKNVKSKNIHNSRINKKLLKTNDRHNRSVEHNNASNTRQTRLNKMAILPNNKKLICVVGEKYNYTMNNSKSFVPITQSTKNSSSITSNSSDESRRSIRSNITTRSNNLSANLNSSAETTLHTIIHDYSQPMSLLRDDSVSSRKSFTPRRSLRMEHSNTSPSSNSTRSSANRNKQKYMNSSRVGPELVTRSRRKIETKR